MIIKRPVLFLTALLAGFFLFTKDLSSCYDKVIMAEGHGYYSYLLTTYIYDDPTFEFFNELYDRYYCEGFVPPVRNFMNEFDGIRVNKYYPGVSLLWLPFFLIAHFIAFFFGLSADGYSDIYQYAIGLAGIFYTGLGLHFTRRILMRYSVSDSVQAVVLASILFGTNLLIYAGAWSSQTHAYSFFLVAAFSFYAFRLFDLKTEDKSGTFALLIVLSALLVSVRPQTAAVFFLFPLFGASWSGSYRIIRENIKSFKVLFATLIASLILIRVGYYWYLQTGRWFLYPYHGESYDLTDPHVLDMLFSFRKGWLLYSPFIIFGLIGIFFFKTTKERINVSLFWILLVYVSSCWWCWTYSQTSFGQRTFVDFYALIGLQAGLFLENSRRSKWFIPLIILCGSAIALNILQTHQYRHGILDGDLCDREIYFRNFFKTESIAQYPVPVSSILNKSEATESFDDRPSGARIIPSMDKRGSVTLICDSVIYSEGITTELPLFLDGTENSHVRITADIRAPYGIDKSAYLVMELKRGETPLGYSSLPLVPYIHEKEWTTVQFGIQSPDKARAGDRVKVYGWKNGDHSLDTVFIDDLRVEFLQTDSSYFIFKK